MWYTYISLACTAYAKIIYLYFLSIRPKKSAMSQVQNDLAWPARDVLEGFQDPNAAYFYILTCVTLWHVFEGCAIPWKSGIIPHIYGPVARELYGYAGIRRSKHQKNICSLLHILFMHGKCTTWEMAQTHMRGVPAIREQEKSYRRLLVGRTDRSKRSPA